MRAADVLAALRDRGETLATAESLTGGLVAARLTSVPGASDVLRGGIVSYATDLKASLLGVSGELLAAGGAVQAEVAEQMAAGVARACGATWGVATTGVAGPAPQDGRPVGTVFVAVAGPVHLVRALTLDGDREAIREATVDRAIALLAEAARTAPGASARE